MQPTSMPLPRFLQRCTGPQRSMTALAIGNSLDPVSTVLIQYGLRRELEAEVSLLQIGYHMREVKELASTIKDAVAGLRKTNEYVKSAFNAEVQRATVNADKLRSFTQELKDANAELEASLGDTGSNFPTSEESSTPAQPSVTDRNGVTLNTEK